MFVHGSTDVNSNLPANANEIKCIKKNQIRTFLSNTF